MIRRNGTGRGLTIPEVLVGAGCVAVILAIGTTVVAKGGGVSDSHFKLAELAQANECYANDFGGRQFGVMPATAGQYGDTCATFISQAWCPRPIYLGFSANGAMWGYYIGGVGFCANSGYPGNCGNWSLYRPMNFSAAEAAVGSFRMPNVVGFREYLSHRFYSPEWYAEDDPGYAWASTQFNADDEFNFDGTNYRDSSFCFSPAAMLHPGVLRARAEGGFQAPAGFSDSYRAPAVTQCTHPSLKTRMCEYGWYRGAPTTGLAFNAGRKSAPCTLFFDGSVQSVSMLHAEADDTIVRAGSKSGDGLWSDDTPLGVDGWQPTAPVDGVRTSFHILTTNGILGRDLLTRD